MIDFEWDKECNWKYVMLDSNQQYDMSVNDSNKNRESLKYVNPSTAKEMLGVHLAPDGNNDEQVQQMKKSN